MSMPLTMKAKQLTVHSSSVAKISLWLQKGKVSEHAFGIR
jgi:hypothetical protein